MRGPAVLNHLMYAFISLNKYLSCCPENNIVLHSGKEVIVFFFLQQVKISEIYILLKLPANKQIFFKQAFTTFF